MKNYNRKCVVCEKEFVATNYLITTCSNICYKESRRRIKKKSYNKRRYGIKIKGKKCIICGFKETVDVHHEGNKKVILCPNHHALITRKIKTLAELKEYYVV